MLKRFKKEAAPAVPEVPKESLKQKLHNFIGLVKKEAENLVKESLLIREKMKNLAETNYQLGLMHMEKGNYSDAAMRFKMVCHFKPDAYPQAYYYLGRVALIEEKTEENTKEAVAYFTKALSLQPDYAKARFMLDRITQPEKITAIPLAITEENFDAIAERYPQECIEDLNYQAHKHLVSAVDDALGDMSRRLRIADIGCGTGLCGVGFKKLGFVRQLDGIDISAKMLEYCKELKVNENLVYDNLYHKDVVSFLKGVNQPYDLISAAAVFYYLGDLKPVLEACKKALQPGGLLAFSVEKSDSSDMVLSQELDSFSYSEAYVKGCALDTGFEEVSSKIVTLYDGCTGYQFVFKAKA